MTTKSYIIIAYLVMFVVTVAYVFSKLGGHKGYRLLCSVIAGVFWPIPAIMAAWLFVEGMMFSLINWFEGNGKK